MALENENMIMKEIEREAFATLVQLCEVEQERSASIWLQSMYWWRRSTDNNNKDNNSMSEPQRLTYIYIYIYDINNTLAINNNSNHNNNNARLDQTKGNQSIIMQRSLIILCLWTFLSAAHNIVDYYLFKKVWDFLDERVIEVLFKYNRPLWILTQFNSCLLHNNRKSKRLNSELFSSRHTRDMFTKRFFW